MSARSAHRLSLELREVSIGVSGASPQILLIHEVQPPCVLGVSAVEGGWGILFWIRYAGNH